jgi:hypothetical protein
MTTLTLDNISSYGVEELDADSAAAIDGGFPWAAIAIGLAVAYVWDIASDIQGAAAAVADGYHTVAG